MKSDTRLPEDRELRHTRYHGLREIGGTLKHIKNDTLRLHLISRDIFGTDASNTFFGINIIYQRRNNDRAFVNQQKTQKTCLQRCQSGIYTYDRLKLKFL